MIFGTQALLIKRIIAGNRFKRMSRFDRALNSPQSRRRPDKPVRTSSKNRVVIARMITLPVAFDVTLTILKTKLHDGTTPVSHRSTVCLEASDIPPNGA
jgi:hypothetical protein